MNDNFINVIAHLLAVKGNHDGTVFAIEIQNAKEPEQLLRIALGAEDWRNLLPVLQQFLNQPVNPGNVAGSTTRQ